MLMVAAAFNVLRTTTVRDVTMMYCQERYMENVPGKYRGGAGNEER